MRKFKPLAPVSACALRIPIRGYETLKNTIASTSASISIDVTLNASQALAELTALRSTPTINVAVRAEVQAAQALAELTALKTLAQDTVMRVEVRVDSVAANTALVAFRAGLNNETIRINIDASGTVGAQVALDGIRNAVLGLGAALATTLPVLRDYNDELNRMQLAARAAAGEIRRAADEQERLRRAGGGGGGKPHHRRLRRQKGISGIEDRIRVHEMR